MADNLDKTGLKKEADYIDSLIRKIAGEEPTLANALKLACEKFVDKTPDPVDNMGNKVPLSGRGRKVMVELGDVYGNVAFYINGHREYPLLSYPEGRISSSSFKSEDEILKTLIESVREAFFYSGMSEEFKNIKFKSPVKVQLYNGLSGFRIETNIPFKQKPYSKWDSLFEDPKMPKEIYERPKTHIVEEGETLEGIASRYNLLKRELMEANGISFMSSKLNPLEPGKVLRIPSKDEFSDEGQPYGEQIVNDGSMDREEHVRRQRQADEDYQRAFRGWLEGEDL